MFMCNDQSHITDCFCDPFAKQRMVVSNFPVYEAQKLKTGPCTNSYRCTLFCCQRSKTQTLMIRPEPSASSLEFGTPLGCTSLTRRESRSTPGTCQAKSCGFRSNLLSVNILWLDAAASVRPQVLRDEPPGTPYRQVAG